MFDKNSIKYRLIIVLSAIILVSLGALFVLQIANVSTLNNKIEKNNIEFLDQYSKKKMKEEENQLSLYLDHYLDMIKDIIASDLYNLDASAIDEMLERFLEYRGICSIEVVDEISGNVFSIKEKPSCPGEHYLKSSDIIYKHELLGTIKIKYQLDFIKQKIAHDKAFFNHSKKELGETLRSISINFFIYQILIFALVSLLIVYLVVRQLNRNVIKPIDTLLYEMKTLNGESFNKPEHSDFSKDEIGQLSKYFHKHVAKLIAQLNHRINYDALTPLYSRQKLFDDVARYKEFNIAILDIDRFKEINNYLGIKVGDEVLIESANKMMRFFDEKGFKLYRLNGDEFAVVDKNPKNPKEFERDIGAFIDYFSSFELELKTEKLHVSICGGIADSNATIPVMAASTALKYAKQKKFSYVIYDNELPIIKEYEKNLLITNIIKQAIEADLIYPHYQAIADIRTKAVYKYEALMRIGDQQGTVYAPYHFLDISKKSNTYPILSKRMIEKVLEEFRDNEFEVSVNLSVEDILDGDVYNWLDELFERHPIAERVIFEITEQEGIDNFDSIKRFVDRVKAYGSKVAIDDFGSGYSNFENLIHLKVDFLKIDGSLIKNITHDESSQMIVETIVSFTQRLNIKTVAEFVSSEAIYEKVKSMGIDFVQGYYIGKPEPKTV